ncbi:MAG: SIR2 family protein [Terriglobia bacterium]
MIVELEEGKKLRQPTTSNCDWKGLRKRMQQSCYLDSESRRLRPGDRCVKLYAQDGLVLFLGAGVSVDSGIPNWSCLIDDLLKKGKITLHSGASNSCLKSASQILSQEASLPLTAQFDLITNGDARNEEASATERDRAFAQRIYDSLYGKRFSPKLKKWLRGIPPEHTKKERYKHWDDILGEFKKNATLEAVAELLLHECQGNNLRANPNIPAVITVNADNLLQMYVLARSKGKAVGKYRILNTVDRPSVGEHPKMIPIFHLHGYLDVRYAPRNGAAADDGSADKPAPMLVFRESEYFESIANARGFANYTAHSLLQRYNVLFIGTSLDDINVRRWLHNSYHERASHRARYLREIYRQPYADADIEAKHASIRHFWLRRENDLPEPRNKMKKYMETLMRRFGVEIVWYAEHTEVAGYLRQLKAATQARDAVA